MLAKAETKSDIEELDKMMGEAEEASGLESGAIKIIPLIESAKGVVNVYEIASVGKRVIAVAFGSGDYYRDLGRSVASLSPEQTELLYARSQIVNASVASRVPAIDTVFFGLLTDKEAFGQEIRLAFQLGFKGKLLVHPTQIEPVNKVFSPSSDEVKYANRVVEAFEAAQAKGLGAVSFEGKMIDEMNYKQAKDVVNFAELVSKKEEMRQEAGSVSFSHFFPSACR